MVILFSTKCFLFVYMYIDLLKLKAYKLFENSDADLSWLLFYRNNLLLSMFDYGVNLEFIFLLGFTVIAELDTGTDWLTLSPTNKVFDNYWLLKLSHYQPYLQNSLAAF